MSLNHHRFGGDNNQGRKANSMSSSDEDQWRHDQNQLRIDEMMQEVEPDYIEDEPSGSDDEE